MPCRVPVILAAVLLAGCLHLAQAADDQDISCKEAGQYIGGIDRHWQLTITGPKEKKWDYTFTHAPAGAVENGDIKTGGTYELSGGLAIFTAKDARFGLSYGFPGGKVEFNGFFPAGDQMLRYQRQWYKQRDGKWEVVEEIVLTMPGVAPDGNRWSVSATGEHMRRDTAGKEQRTKIDEKLNYDKLEGTPQYRLHRPKGRMPYTLIPRMKGKTVEAVLTADEGHSPFGYMRGFSPALANLTEN